jgi:phosphatidylserine decarboxylase
MSVGHAPGEPMWTPDMRKDDDQITAADKAEAKRRIQGQVAEESPDDSGSAGSGPDIEAEVEADAEAGGRTVHVPPMASLAG